MGPVVVDFETLPIERRPDYPPKPIGVALKFSDEKSFYWHWGSPREGSPMYDRELERHAQRLLTNIWMSDAPLIFHHAKFDCEVAEAWCNLPLPDWPRIHDTQFLAYLEDPHARSMGLKPLAQRWLGWAPEEQDALKKWVMANKARLKELDPRQPVTEANMGAWIWAAPPELVTPYGAGDVDRTEGLFNFLLPRIEEAGMRQAYDRERQLMPILLRNEQQGMRLDMELCEREFAQYEQAFAYVEDGLRWALGAPELNLDADQKVAEALLSAGLVLEANMPQTDKGNWSLSKEVLTPDLFEGEFGKQVASALGYRNRLATAIYTFMGPWLKQARVNGGMITTTWNQIRSPDGGTRTGRPSTFQHNFLNVAKEFGKGRDSETGYVHPDFLNVPPLPRCRRYVLPDDGHVWLHRDFDGQELRIFGHHEQGELWQKYQDDPKTDPHAFVQAKILELRGQAMEREPVKALNFQGIYGGGAPAAAKKLKVSLAEGKAFKAMHNEALPGRKLLDEEICRLARQNLPIRTLDGRLFYAEDMQHLYKLINYLIQGGSAGFTKQALIDWHENPVSKTSRFLVTVYDEVNISAPAEEAAVQMAILRHEMERQRLGMTVKMLSSGKWGHRWGELEKCL